MAKVHLVGDAAKRAAEDAAKARVAKCGHGIMLMLDGMLRHDGGNEVETLEVLSEVACEILRQFPGPARAQWFELTRKAADEGRKFGLIAEPPGDPPAPPAAPEA